jgi:hypothetical protein
MVQDSQQSQDMCSTSRKMKIPNQKAIQPARSIPHTLSGPRAVLPSGSSCVEFQDSHMPKPLNDIHIFQTPRRQEEAAPTKYPNNESSPLFLTNTQAQHMLITYSHALQKIPVQTQATMAEYHQTSTEKKRKLSDRSAQTQPSKRSKVVPATLAHHMHTAASGTSVLKARGILQSTPRKSNTNARRSLFVNLKRNKRRSDQRFCSGPLQSSHQ